MQFVLNCEQVQPELHDGLFLCLFRGDVSLVVDDGFALWKTGLAQAFYLPKGGLLFYSPGTDVASGIVAFGRFADLYAFFRAGMNEGEVVGDRVYLDDNAHVSDVLARTRTGEKHQVATLQVASLHGDVALVLLTRAAADVLILLLFVDIACETGTVEPVRPLAPQPVGSAQVRHGLAHQVFYGRDIVAEVFVIIVKKIVVVYFLVSTDIDFLVYLRPRGADRRHEKNRNADKKFVHSLG